MEGSRQIQLIAPAERGSVRLARILAGGVAADAGLSIDDTEDLRIAVSELVALLDDGCADEQSTVVVRFRRRPGEGAVVGPLTLLQYLIPPGHAHTPSLQ